MRRPPAIPIRSTRRCSPRATISAGSTGFLVGGDRVEIDDVRQFGNDAQFTNANTGAFETLNDRPSLLLHAIVRLPKAGPLAVIVNHLRSLSGIDDPADGARVRSKRRAQAEFLAGYVKNLQSEHSGACNRARRRLQRVSGRRRLRRRDRHHPRHAGSGRSGRARQRRSAGSRSDRSRLDRPPDQRYSYVFDGNAQELDHALVNPAAFASFTRLEFARNDADFTETYRSDASRPERISDHDMLVAYFVAPPDLPPVVSAIAPDTNKLWPPNHVMVPVSVSVSVTDDVDAVVSHTVTGVASNEPGGQDARVTEPLQVELRADRSGGGSGRVSTIGVQCTDSAGNVTPATTTVVVPHDPGP